eukprot:CAMPEP_0203759056 /NCGR_PEP_ID=MMETSP0098-20131031/11975_1 /ASSEMBLY_ACC=CAM_ASM_000208 /TAXON_ID=96639 /ORGANISM=" , Strain NY0313808BC1" /LENGTH=610 /DNA_ID=CAMNT_0050651785 /DNA_START=434 /DNA_END=2266 /DNA_ORIENTATION=-
MRALLWIGAFAGVPGVLAGNCCTKTKGDSACYTCATTGADVANCFHSDNPEELVYILCGSFADGTTASIPLQVSALTNLEYLNFDGPLEGSLPSGLFTLTNLKELYLKNNAAFDYNMESGNWGDLTSLEILDISSDPNLSGEVPESLGKIDSLSTINVNDSPNLCTSSQDQAFLAKIKGQINECSSPTPPSPGPPSPGPPSPGPPSPGPPSPGPPSPGPPSPGPPAPVPTPAPTHPPTNSSTGALPYDPYCGVEYIDVPGYNAQFWCTAVIAAISIIAGVGGTVYIGMYRERPIFAVAAPYVMMACCAGLALGNLANFLYAFALFSPSGTLCGVNSWLIFLSYTVVITSLGYLLLKTGPTGARVSFNKFLILVGVVFGVVALLLILWSAIESDKPDPCRLYICGDIVSSKVSIFAICLEVLLLLLGIALLVVVVLHRNEPTSFAMPDGAILSSSLLVLLFLLWILLDLVVSGDSFGATSYLLFALVSCILTLAAVYFLTVRKARMLEMTENELAILQETHRSSKSDCTKLEEEVAVPVAIVADENVAEANRDSNDYYPEQEKGGRFSRQASEWRENGFKVGDDEVFSFYIHRQTGDPFRINHETQEVLLE